MKSLTSAETEALGLAAARKRRAMNTQNSFIPSIEKTHHYHKNDKRESFFQRTRDCLLWATQQFIACATQSFNQGF